MSDTVLVCGHEHPDLTGLKPCCLEPNHDGEHRYWVQGRKPDGDGWYIHTYNEQNKTEQLLDLSASSTDEEVAAFIQYMELLRGRG